MSSSPCKSSALASLLGALTGSGANARFQSGQLADVAREARQVVTAMSRLLGLEAPIKITHTDPTGDIERSPADWIMPMPPERDPHEWAAETRTMLASREAVADKMVEELLGAASKAGQPETED